MRTSIDDYLWEDGLPWPRLQPSLALKRQIIGVENLRYRSQLKPFYFRHRAQPIVGYYRQRLWPDTDEDPLYMLLDGLAGEHLLADPGYRCESEVHKAGGLDVHDVDRSLIEDADEIIAAGHATTEDWLIKTRALTNLGEFDAALSTLDNTPMASDASMQNLKGIVLQRMGRESEARSCFQSALEINSNHPGALFNFGQCEYESGNLAGAATLLDKAIQAVEERIPEGIQLSSRTELSQIHWARAVIASRLGDEACAERMVDLISPWLGPREVLTQKLHDISMRDQH